MANPTDNADDIGVGRRVSVSCAELTLPKPSSKFINPPKQRQKWGDTQEYPHVNWGDLFFDLFYVGAAYNLAAILKDSKNLEGLLYFVGTGGPVFLFWFDKMMYDSRFVADDDPVHRIFEVIQLCFLSTAVLHIRPVSLMSNPHDNVDMFAFSLAAFLGSFGTIVRYLEVEIWVVGQPQARTSARSYIMVSGPSTVLFLAAAIISGIAYFDSSHDSDHRALAVADDENYSNYASNDERTNNIPIYLCVASWVSYLVCSFVHINRLPHGDALHKLTVPMNLEFVIHRYGEWTMLMLGESVLSLLIVDVSEGSNYYITFYAGILSVIMLQYLHFRSQPHDADDHALRRDKTAGLIFVVAMQIYSAALIIIGASYKMLLTEYIYESDSGKNRLLRTVRFVHEYAARFLAGTGGGTKLSREERQQAIANLFCGSMAVVFVCLDLMILCHKGVRTSITRCRCPNSGKVRMLGIILTILRVGLVVFIVTLSQYATDPELVAVIGLACVVAQVMVRSIGAKIFPNEKVEKVDRHICSHIEEKDEDNEDEKWPNVTYPKSEPSPTESKARVEFDA